MTIFHWPEIIVHKKRKFVIEIQGMYRCVVEFLKGKYIFDRKCMLATKKLHA